MNDDELQALRDAVAEFRKAVGSFRLAAAAMSTSGQPLGRNEQFQKGDAWEFMAGTIRGLRAFRLDGNGFLTGVSWQAPWHVGENLAQCFRNQPSSVTQPQPPHDLNDECPCGFYSYFAEQHANSWDGKFNTVVGVVEGYGRCIIGANGMRTSKARILALAYRTTLLAPPAAEARVRAVSAAMFRYRDIPSYTNEADMLADWPVSPKPIGPGLDARAPQTEEGAA